MHQLPLKSKDNLLKSLDLKLDHSSNNYNDFLSMNSSVECRSRNLDESIDMGNSLNSKMSIQDLDFNESVYTHLIIFIFLT